jgi:CDP-glucose 4,6-dehydratase
MGSGAEPVILSEATHEIRKQFLSAAKARKSLGWTPLFDLEEGLHRTVAWYREFLAAKV